ncbi:hypothetical protein JHK85_048260 [Glycine max]|nr:hypothetical protein JHK85_048260 [Glycine max]
MEELLPNFFVICDQVVLTLPNPIHMIQVGNGQLQRKDDMWPPDVAPTPSPPLTEARPSSSHVNARGPSPVPTSTPSPSSVDARRLSPVPTPTPSPSPPVGNMPTNEDAINLAMEDPPLNDRPMELGRSVYVDEIFQQTHLQKDTGQFVDDRSRRTHEEFEARLSQARSDAASSVGESQLTLLDPAEEQRLRS